jgi:hypothetical protein
MPVDPTRRTAPPPALAPFRALLGRAIPLLCFGLSALGCDQARVLRHTAAIDGAFGAAELGEQEDDLHVTKGDELRRIDLLGRPLDTYPSGDKRLRLVDLDERDLAKGPKAYVTDGAGLWRVLQDEVELLIDVDDVDLRAVALIDGGMVTLELDPEDGCALKWHDSAVVETARVLLPGAACAEGALLRADRSNGDAFVVTLTGVWAATPGFTPFTWPQGGNLAAFDPAVGAVVIGTRRDTELRAWTVIGEELWYQDLGEPLIEIDDMGALGALGVLSSRGEGGRIILLDTAGGEPLTAEDLPVAPVGLSAGRSGARLALRLDAELHVFDVDLEAR